MVLVDINQQLKKSIATQQKNVPKLVEAMLVKT